MTKETTDNKPASLKDKKEEKVIRKEGIYTYIEAQKKSYEEVQKELLELDKKDFTSFHIIDELTRHPQLCTTFTAIVKAGNGARMYDIKKDTTVCNKTNYDHVWKLKRLGLIDFVPVMNLWNKNNLNGIEKEIIEKFKEWTIHMSEGQRNEFAGKTRYFILTPLGKDPLILNWVLQQMKNGRRMD